MAQGAGHVGDAELVAAVSAGNKAAYATLVDRHLAVVYAVVMRIVGNRADAEDITQDVFIRALQKLDQFSSRFSFRNWLLKIASNLAINHLRARKRERLRLPRLFEIQDARGEEQQGSSRHDTSPTAPADWQPLLGQLSAAERAAITLFHFQGLSYLEVAEALQLPINSVRTHLHRGRKKLRDFMAGSSLPESGSWTVAT